MWIYYLFQTVKIITEKKSPNHHSFVFKLLWENTRIREQGREWTVATGKRTCQHTQAMEAGGHEGKWEPLTQLLTP